MFLLKSRNYEGLIFENIPRITIENVDIYTADRMCNEKLYYYFFSKEQNKLYFAYSRKDDKYVNYIEDTKKKYSKFIGNDVNNDSEAYKGALLSEDPKRIDLSYKNKTMNYNFLDMHNMHNIPFVLYILFTFEEKEDMYIFLCKKCECPMVYSGTLIINAWDNTERMKKVFSCAVVRNIPWTNRYHRLTKKFYICKN